VALVTLDRAGQIIKPGAQIELEPETAAILLEYGFVERIEGAPEQMEAG
jgi:hypothetical protein